MSKYATIVLATGAGLVAGLVGSLAMQHLGAGREQQHAIPTEQAPDRNTPVDWVTQSQHSRLRALELRMASIQASTVGDTARATQKPDKATPEEMEQHVLELNPEQGYEQAMERWNDVLAEFETDPIDAAWAEAAKNEFKDDLLQLGEQAGFRLLSTECRTTFCAGKTTWPNYAEALAGFRHLLHHSYKLNCATEATLPDPIPGSEDVPYEVTVIFDCTEARSEG